MRVLFSFKLNPFIIWRKFLSYSQCSVCLAFKKKKRNYFIILGPQETAGNLLVFKLSEVSILSFQVKVHLAAEKKKTCPQGKWNVWVSSLIRRCTWRRLSHPLSLFSVWLSNTLWLKLPSTIGRWTRCVFIHSFWLSPHLDRSHDWQMLAVCEKPQCEIDQICLDLLTSNEWLIFKSRTDSAYINFTLFF